MKYVGMQTQIWRNNRNTALLLLVFPMLVIGLEFAVVFLIDFCGLFGEGREFGLMGITHWDKVRFYFLKYLPAVVVLVGLWLFIAYCSNTAIIRRATGARPLERKENVRVYNIVENLCIAGGIEMPMINIVEDDWLNAYASGVDIKSYTITLTTGLIEKLTDEELAAVVGHELTHIRNRDTRLMIVCIVFVGIFSTLQSVILNIFKGMFRASGRSSGRRGKKGGVPPQLLLILLALLILTSVGYVFSFFTRLAISRSREYVADAGAAELCGDPLALARALDKISHAPGLCSVGRSDLAQLYVCNPEEEFDEEENSKLNKLVFKINSMFWTHPDTSERIRILKQF